MTMDSGSIVIKNTSGPVTNLQSPEENVMATVNQFLVSSVTVYQRYFHVTIIDVLTLFFVGV